MSTDSVTVSRASGAAQARGGGGAATDAAGSSSGGSTDREGAVYTRLGSFRRCGDPAAAREVRQPRKWLVLGPLSRYPGPRSPPGQAATRWCRVTRRTRGRIWSVRQSGRFGSLIGSACVLHEFPPTGPQSSTSRWNASWISRCPVPTETMPPLHRVTPVDAATPPRLVVTGAGGQLGSDLVRVLRGATRAGLAWQGLTRAECDIADSAPGAGRAGRSGAGPPGDAGLVVINAAAYTNVDGAETDEAGAYAVNAAGAGASGDGLRRGRRAAGARLDRLRLRRRADGVRAASLRGGRRDRPADRLRADEARPASRRCASCCPSAATWCAAAGCTARPAATSSRRCCGSPGSATPWTSSTTSTGAPTWTFELADRLVDAGPVRRAGRHLPLLRGGAGELVRRRPGGVRARRARPGAGPADDDRRYGAAGSAAGLLGAVVPVMGRCRAAADAAVGRRVDDGAGPGRRGARCGPTGTDPPGQPRRDRSRHAERRQVRSGTYRRCGRGSLRS